MLRDPRREALPLPAALRDRLKAIPGQVVVCRDRERLYAAALAPARGLPPEPPAAGHLAACGRCRTLYATLESAFVEPPRRPSPSLLGRLRTIARRPAVPAWIADGRYAAAACFLLTVALSSFAGDSAALFRDASQRVESRAAAWAQAGESCGRQAWDGLAAVLAAGYDAGRSAIAESAESAKALFEEAVRDVGSLVRPKPTESQGDNDDKPESDSA